MQLCESVLENYFDQLENLKINMNILESCIPFPDIKIINLGSSCIYPKFASQPIQEEELLNGALEETNQWYAIAKIAGVRLCEALNTQYGFDSLCLMPSNLYGQGDNYHYKDSHVIPGLIRRFHDCKINNSSTVNVWGSGKPRREFLFVDDLAKAVLCSFKLFSI